MVEHIPEDESPKLPPHMKAMWLEALRSGGYKQCRGSLKEGDSYCCLGVLQEIIGEETLPTHHKGWDYLDYKQSNVIGLTDRIQTKLAGLNDRLEGFGPVADWIEANL